MPVPMISVALLWCMGFTDCFSAAVETPLRKALRRTLSSAEASGIDSDEEGADVPLLPPKRARAAGSGDQ